MASNPQYLTKKQYQILTVLCDGNGYDDAGIFTPADLDQLLDRVAYRTGKDSMQFSLRVLVNAGYVIKNYEKRRGARRVTFTPTKLCRKVMQRQDPSFIEDSDLALIDII